MRRPGYLLALTAGLIAACTLPLACGGGHEPPAGVVRAPSLASDPGWQGLNNRGHSPCRTVVQAFGWRPGAIGGVITRATRPAFYGKAVDFDLNRAFSASGTLVVHGTPGGARASGSGGGAAMLGFFRHDIAQWRAPDSLAMGISTGGVKGGDYAIDAQFGTRHLMAGGAFVTRIGSSEPYPFRFGRTYRWELDFDPDGTAGRVGVIVGQALVAEAQIPIAARADGARLDRFGLATEVNGAGAPLSLDVGNVVLEGAHQDLRRDPAWDSRANRISYRDCQTGSRASDFGWTGPADRRVGGIVWRTDEHHPAQRAFYADRTSRLTLNDPLTVKGTLQLRRANSDSATLLGWFDAARDAGGRAGSAPPSFLGLRIDGVTRSGLQVAPVASPAHGRPRSAKAGIPITPGRRTVPFALRYHPRRGPGGRIDLRVGDRTVSWDLNARVRRHGAVFDHFGLRTLELGGSWQEVYFGDLRYTVAPPPRG
jgi:hypothetical protein